MEWINSIFFEHSALQAIIILSLTTAIGISLGKIRIGGISLGVTFVFFMGIVAGHLGISLNPDMLNYAESFGLVLFVYSLGLQVGPGFFSAFRKEGIQLNLLGLIVILLGTAMAIIISYASQIPLKDMIGVLCGATTNTPALGAAQQTLKQLGQEASSAALSCAVTYPLGVVGVILAIIVIKKLIARPQDMDIKQEDDPNHTYIAAFQVHNPGIYGKKIETLANDSHTKFVISRLWRNGKVSIPSRETILMENDRILVVTIEKDMPILTMLFGEQENRDWNKEDIDWNSIDRELVSSYIVVTRPEINGRRLGSLRLRNAYDINVSRVLRSGVKLLATPDLVLQLGDRLTVVGDAAAIKQVEKILGNTVTSLKEPNLAAIFIGIVMGLILGAIPISIPGIDTPVKLGLAGGPIVVGILVGCFGPRLHMRIYTTRSANLMLRAIGLSLYLACLGIDAGAHFFETVMRPEGAAWIGIGFAITLIPVILVGWIALRFSKMDFRTTCGMLCGSMANPMALSYVNDTYQGSNQASVSYATVYPLAMFIRVILAQIILMIFI
ncbi:putative transporter [Bacteroides sp. OF04-15BH]|jgi:AspT/YidE/YbjL antiporter-like protein|uniref:putative transporter n=1 Tax=Bacteroides sp. OF04-15BH TaxID=2292281 RepID=UPI000E523A7E|nr:putative transporter [Bacteroides sp. OF04-15BH]RHP63219.1 putative transporter [Bacteroides sp. OF04-15BH]